MTPAPQKKPHSAALFKLTGLIKGWKQVFFRESDIVEGATYLLKFDGIDNDTGRKEQIQLLITPHDAAAVSTALEKLLRKNHLEEYRFYQDIHGVERK